LGKGHGRCCQELVMSIDFHHTASPPPPETG
jgi:hypothetical protein